MVSGFFISITSVLAGFLETLLIDASQLTTFLTSTLHLSCSLHLISCTFWPLCSTGEIALASLLMVGKAESLK